MLERIRSVVVGGVGFTPKTFTIASASTVDIMPFEQVVPPIFPTYERDVGGMPHTSIINLGATVGGTFGPGYDNARSQGTTSTPFGDQITAMSAANWQRHRGVVSIQFSPAAFDVGYWWGDSVMMTGPVDDGAGGAFPCAVDGLPSYRVYIDDVYVAFETPATLGLDTKPIIYVPTESTIEPSVSGVANDQYGIRADGAGGFEFFSAIAGVQTEAVALTWPTANLADFVKITVEHQIASASGAGQVRFFLNDNAVLTRAFSLATMPTLEDGTTADDSSFMRRASISGVSGPDTDMFLTMFRCRAGRFTVEGTEL